jgi:pre-mRNA-processing factor 39
LAYEGVLYQFPLLYGYWKKYAELEDFLQNIEKAVEIYERGVREVNSVDLWTFYCVYVSEKTQNIEVIRK